MNRRLSSGIGKNCNSSNHGLWVDNDEEWPINFDSHNVSPSRRGLRERSPNLPNGGISKGKAIRTSDPGKSVYAIQKEALCRELKTSNQIRRQLEEQIVNLKSECRSKTEALKRSAPNLEVQLNESMARCDELASQVDSALSQIQKRDDDIEQLAIALDEERRRFEAACSELDAVKGARQDLEPLIELLKSELKGTQVELEQKTKTLSVVNESLANSQSRNSEIAAHADELQQQLETNSASLLASQSQVEELKSQIKSMEETLSQLSRTVAEQDAYISRQREEFDDQIALQMHDHEAMLANLQRCLNETIADSASSIENEKRSHDDTRKLLMKAEGRIEELEKNFKDIKKESEQHHLSSSEQVRLASQSINDLHAHLNELEPKYLSLKETCARQQSELKLLQTTLKSAESQALSLKENEHNLKERISSLTEENRLFDSQRVELARGFENEKLWREQVSAQLIQSESLCTKLQRMIELNATESDKKTRDLLTQIEELRNTGEQSKLELALIKNDLDEANRNLKRLPAMNIIEQARLSDRTKIDALQSELQTHLELLKQERGTTRRLQNQVQELKGSIRIVARLRPEPAFSVNEASAASIFNTSVKLTTSEVFLTETEKTAQGTDRTKSMRVQFDRVFGPEASNEAICEETEYLVQSALDGGQVCILAYGQTGSGKTYTMGGSNGVSTSALQTIMRAVKAAPLNQYCVSVECVEIYNEVLRDLLEANQNHTAATGSTTTFQMLGGSRPSIQLNPTTGIPELAGSTRIPVHNEREALDVLQCAMKHRITAATHANQRSSRSHFVFSVHIDTANTRGLLHLVDLAGSERLAQSKTEGSRLRETQAINTSLSSLGNVINALLNRRPSTHIPYRSSKLTYLLQGSLSGNAKTMLLTTLSPGIAYIDETKSTLRFAEKASRATLK